MLNFSCPSMVTEPQRVVLTHDYSSQPLTYIGSPAYFRFYPNFVSSLWNVSSNFTQTKDKDSFDGDCVTGEFSFHWATATS